MKNMNGSNVKAGYMGKVLCMLMATLLLACQKPPGPGGNATVKGKVYARDFDNTQRYEIGKGYAAGEKVYICYGNTNIVGNTERTSTDGTFEFRYLTKGHYKVFVNSLDTSIKWKGNDSEIPVVKEFDITSSDQTVQLPDFVINR
jgi:hypothetical protein